MEKKKNDRKIKKSAEKIWWFQKKAVPLHPLLRNNSTAR